ncbi:MAG: bifunctional 23S rRNA (guanine(2069)-N(7))-methyltransferase RlmK/23S rRNA (guanine(2445)-N(2))-methyltransferase RlmL [Gammaproteobacteria bacterium]|nr:bifunctional 23S rRNA (guanine(2069)-N(7))-methyltransferase RlmK/23S rRNA (guanine(2445)-N(2))-methyltransferase RlmL [Gammaproteobacteria bacterium]
MNHDSEHSTGVFAIGTLLATDDLVAEEVQKLGLEVKGRQLGWVTAEGSLGDAYRMLMTTQVGDRVVWLLARGEALAADQFRELLRTIDWNVHLYAGASVRVDITGKVSWLKDTRFAGQLVMDAIRDQAMIAKRPRPEYETDEPAVRIAVRFGRGHVDIGINLNRAPLNQRGYRTEGGEAPLRETLAQVMLARLKIQQDQPSVIIDPCCGSGTLLIEACIRLNQIAPQRQRPSSQLSRWRGLESISWTDLIASERIKEIQTATRFVGFDINPQAVDRARANIERAGLSEQITVEVAEIADLSASNAGITETDTVWILANPPYGTRLGRNEDLATLYRLLGDRCKEFKNAHLGLVTSEKDLMQALGLRSDKKWEMQAGGLRLNIAKFALGLTTEHFESQEDKDPPEEIWPLLNRLSKNLKNRSKLLKNNEIDCYRIYDSDLPEYNVVIDQFSDYLHIQEYRPPKTVDPKRANHRRQLIRQWVPKHLGIPLKHAVYKERFRQTGNSQYEKRAEPLCVDVHENGMQFEVNLTTYTDVGLFLDHRPLRRRLLESCRGLRVLNLFCYTGALSVAAAKGLARSVTSVDMSKTYLTWAHRNFEKNGLNPKHYQFVRANVLEWLTVEPRAEFEVILLDPPTFSNTKSTEQTLDIQRDHRELIDACSAWLAPGGVIYFSNNFKGFSLDDSVREAYVVEDMTRQSIDADFDRKPPHVLFKISVKP